MNPLRILFVTSGLAFGGAETQIIALARELARQGHAVALYLLTPKAPRLGELEGAGITVTVDDKRSRLDLGVLQRLRRFLRDWRADIVQGFLFDGNLYARLAGAGCGIPVLNSERSDNYRLSFSQALIHRPTRFLAAGVVANSHAGRRHAARLFALPDARTHVVWNGLPPERARPLPHAPAVRQELFADPDIRLATLVGTVSAAKDYELALATAECLVGRDSRWRVAFLGGVVGRFAYRVAAADALVAYGERIAERHRQSSRAASIRFVGQRSDALEVIAGSDVLFSTSLREGFPNVVLEAMAVGTPVVATDFSDIRLILPYPWQVVGERDPERLAEAILRAHRERERITAAQRVWVDAHASIAGAAQALLDVYAAYLPAHGDGAPGTAASPP